MAVAVTLAVVVVLEADVVVVVGGVLGSQTLVAAGGSSRNRPMHSNLMSSAHYSACYEDGRPN